MNGSKLLTIDQAAQLLGVKPATLRAWRALRKNLPFVQCGRAVRVPAEAIERFITDNTIPPREAEH